MSSIVCATLVRRHARHLGGRQVFVHENLFGFSGVRIGRHETSGVFPDHFLRNEPRVVARVRLRDLVDFRWREGLIRSVQRSSAGNVFGCERPSIHILEQLSGRVGLRSLRIVRREWTLRLRRSIVDFRRNLLPGWRGRSRRSGAPGHATEHPADHPRRRFERRAVDAGDCCGNLGTDERRHHATDDAASDPARHRGAAGKPGERLRLLADRRLRLVELAGHGFDAAFDLRRRRCVHKRRSHRVRPEGQLAGPLDPIDRFGRGAELAGGPVGRRRGERPDIARHAEELNRDLGKPDARGFGDVERGFAGGQGRNTDRIVELARRRLAHHRSGNERRRRRRHGRRRRLDIRHRRRRRRRRIGHRHRVAPNPFRIRRIGRLPLLVLAVTRAERVGERGKTLRPVPDRLAVRQAAEDGLRHLQAELVDVVTRRVLCHRRHPLSSMRERSPRWARPVTQIGAARYREACRRSSAALFGPAPKHPRRY